MKLEEENIELKNDKVNNIPLTGAHIIIEDMRFLERIFHEFRSVFTNN
jgi:hypothetical protein